MPNRTAIAALVHGVYAEHCRHPNPAILALYADTLRRAAVRLHSDKNNGVDLGFHEAWTLYCVAREACLKATG